MSNTLLIVGLIFPILSWLSLICGLIQATVKGESGSGVYIPFIGPVCLSVWLVMLDAPGWSLLIPWIADIGTVFFLLWIPQFTRELWQISRFTRVFSLTGKEGNESVEIHFQKNGIYTLDKKWEKPYIDNRIVALGEPGTYEMQGESLIMTSHMGTIRKLDRLGDDYCVVLDETEPNSQLQQWTLHVEKA